MYSLGGDLRFSARWLWGLGGSLSSSVLLASIISLSSVEMMCCCFLGFFLGEAPGVMSAAGTANIWAPLLGPDATERVWGEIYFSFKWYCVACQKSIKMWEGFWTFWTLVHTWFCSVHRLRLLFNIHFWESGANGTCRCGTGCWLSGRRHYVSHGGEWRSDCHGSRYGWESRGWLRWGRGWGQKGGDRLWGKLRGWWPHVLWLLFVSLAGNSLYCPRHWGSEAHVDVRFRLHSVNKFNIFLLFIKQD